MLNGFGQFRTAIDGLGIHFLHIRSPEPDALPMLMTHGWPGSVMEFHQVIGPLTDPGAHGGDPHDAFHLVLPSLPGFGFSDKPQAAGWGVDRIARAWGTLMMRLGYRCYVTQGGDWGAFVTAAIGVARPEGCAGIHLNIVNAPPRDGAAADPDPQEREAFALMKAMGARSSATPSRWAHARRARRLDLREAAKLVRQPGLAGSPVRPRCDAGQHHALLAAERRPSSARLYWESLGDASLSRPTDLPVGVTIFLHDINKSPCRWAQPYFSNIVRWNEAPRGGHFGTFEQPEIFVRELRECFRALR